MRDPQQALEWITSLLEEIGYPYALVGGLAANVYGGTRPLNDIDIDVPKKALSEVVARVRSNVTFGPARYRDEHFDIELLSLCYAGQDIDLTAAEDILLFDRKGSKWRKVPTDLRAVESHTVLGKIVTVMKKEPLIEYKRIVSRDTDLEDVAAMGG